MGGRERREAGDQPALCGAGAMAWSAATQAAATEAAHTGMQSGTCVAYQRNKSGRCSRGTCSHGPSGHAPYPTLTHLHFHTTVRVVVKAPRSTTTHGRVHPLPPPPPSPPSPQVHAAQAVGRQGKQADIHARVLHLGHVLLPVARRLQLEPLLILAVDEAAGGRGGGRCNPQGDGGQ